MKNQNSKTKIQKPNFKNQNSKSENGLKEVKPAHTRDLVSIRTVRKLKLTLDAEIKKLVNQFVVDTDGVKIGEIEITGSGQVFDGSEYPLYNVETKVVSLGE